MKHIKFPKIRHFRNVEQNAAKQQIVAAKFRIHVKIHGMNAVVCRKYNNNTQDYQQWAESHNCILTEETDSTGFAKFVSTRNFDAIFASLQKSLPQQEGEEHVITRG